jgi:spectrin alpha
MDPAQPNKEVRILETAEDIQERREQVLTRYAQFKQDAKVKREKLEDSRKYQVSNGKAKNRPERKSMFFCFLVYFFQYFKRDADELESWIYEKLQAASDESYRDPTNLQVCYILFETFFPVRKRCFV